MVTFCFQKVKMDEPKIVNSLYRIYLNALRFLDYRNFEKVEPITEDKFLKDIQMHEYCLIETKGTEESRYPDRKVFIFIIDENSEYGNAANKFTMLEYFIKRAKDEPVELIVIAYDYPSIHLRRKILEFKKTKIYVSMYIHDNFQAVAPEFPMIPIHEIVAYESDTSIIEKIMEQEKISDLNQLPKIKESDIQAVWHGIKKGDLVKITGFSESAGYRVVYRLCVT